MLPLFNQFTIDARNVHEALPKALVLLRGHGEKQASRNGPVSVSPWPVNTVYRYPAERVIFWADRDANPFFHFMEGLMFIAGVNAVEPYAFYAKQIREYSDDGLTFWGNYGNRWRRWFSFDQLTWAIARLRANPEDRRVVISMWDGQLDPQKVDQGGKDVPCNTQLFLSARRRDEDGHQLLDMQVNCRSNDILWGCYGANAVHFSMLQEFIASAIGAKLGYYIQNSFNWHAYENFYTKMINRIVPPGELALSETLLGSTYEDPYFRYRGDYHAIKPFPMVNIPWENWLGDLDVFLGTEDGSKITEPFFIDVAYPMRNAFIAYKQGHFENAYREMGRVAASDWRVAGTEWLQRREAEPPRARKTA